MKSARSLFANRSSGELPRGQTQLSRSRRLGMEDLEDRRLLTAVPSDMADYLASITAMPLAEINARMLAGPEASPLGTSNPPSNALTPAKIRHAYGMDQIYFGNGTIQGDGSGQTIAIITAYHTPTIAADLALFSSTFGLPQPASFVQLAQDGTTNYGPVDPVAPGPGVNNWALETALDVQWAHAMAPNANIVLVEAKDASFANLIHSFISPSTKSALETALTLPNVTVVSMSFGAAEFNGETSYDTFMTTPAGHLPVTFVAATGDTGSPGMYPAYSPNVLAVGGTTLTLDVNSNIQSETGWSGSGGGISQYENKPSFQSSVTQSATKRTTPDVAFDGNPGAGSGVAVVDSYNNGATPWVRVGGTSFGAPAWAGLVAVANQGRRLAGLSSLDSATLLSKIYSMPASYFNDITSGSNGGFTAAAGYDLVTGRGTPNGEFIVAGLAGTSVIAGQVFNDTNGNGVLEPGESGLSGRTVFQDLDGDNVYDAPVVNTYNGPAKTVTTNYNNTSDIVVSGLSNRVMDVNVKINGTFTGASTNLILTLIAPDNTTYTLISRTGGATFSNAIFDDSAGLTIAQGASPYSVSFQPVGNFTPLIGDVANGTWKLRIQTGSGVSGTLSSWTLELTTGDPSVTSDATGVYTFTGLGAGSYLVDVVTDAPYTQTGPAGGSYSVVLAADSTSTARNFGQQIAPSATPTSVTLTAATDTGASNSDGITKRNNSNGANALQFTITGTVAGATVSLYADGVTFLGSAVASGTSATFSTSGSFTLSDGQHTITARQLEPGKVNSADSPGFIVTIDTVAPVPTITPVTPNPRTSPLPQMTLSFSEAVTGLDLSDLQLTRNGGSNLLTGAQTISSGDSIVWTLGNMTPITSVGGSYTLSVLLTGGPITDIAGNAITSTPTSSFDINLSAPVVDLNGAGAGTGYTRLWTNSGAVFIADTSLASITDGDSTTLSSLSVTLTNPKPGDVLSVATGGLVSSSFNGTTLTLSGVQPLSVYQNLLRSIQYNNTLGGPGVSVITMNVVANDGAFNSAAAVATVDIDVAPPVVDLNGGTAGTGYSTSFVTRGSAVNISDVGAATVTDSDSTALASMVVTLVTPQAGDVLAANTSGTAISASFNGTTLTLSGQDSLANYQQVLRTLSYGNTAFNGPNVATQSVTIVANDGNFNSAAATATINVDSIVSARRLFYNNSKFDNSAGIAAGDDNAIASDKVAYTAGTGTATFANLSSYDKGINGVMIDLSGPHAASLTAADFIFKVGNNNSADLWSDAPAPTAISIRAGAGTSGSDRVEIIWADGAVTNTWLQVTLRGDDELGGFNTNTGLQTSDTFFFGNRIANSGTGNTASFAVTSGTDELAARAGAGLALVTSNSLDFNRDRIVDANDQLLARANPGLLRFISVDSPPLAPQVSALSLVEPISAENVTQTSVPSTVVTTTAASSLSTAPAHRDLQQAAARNLWLAATEQLYGAHSAGHVDDALLDIISLRHVGKLRRR